MGLRILILGEVSGDVRNELGGLEEGVEIVQPGDAWDLRSGLRTVSPHLVVLGEAAPCSAGDLMASDPDRAPDIILTVTPTGDPEADLRLPADPSARGPILRIARKLARMRQALLASPEPFQQRLDYEFSRALRYRHPMSLVTLSLDRRERLCATYGDRAVGQFLATLAETLKRCLRDVDLLFYSEADEISAILPETPAMGASIVADRFRTQTNRLVFKPQVAPLRPMLPLKATSSIGVADGPREGIGTSRDLLDRARESMTSARLAGGDRLQIHGQRPESRAPSDTRPVLQQTNRTDAADV